ncbi:MAG: FAD-binding protein [Lachnospiraceae bacterium]|nr:FAD-binding protein [Lachnospiraceae bacterium]
MKEILIIGSGISGMTCAIRCAEKGMHVKILSPFPSERSQSVMAAGGINAVRAEHESGDSVESHIEDTLKGGCYINGENAVTGLCQDADSIISYLESIGTVFSVDEKEQSMRRAFGGQSHKRTYYCGSSTGKQIVSALIMELRRYEACGLVTRMLGKCFHSALIKDGICYGAVFFDEHTYELEAVYADATVVATGGQNTLFGKTTGSTQCDGYTAGKLFMQGAILKNLEFIQYHPTTIETSQKKMLISEAARGEGGRLFYLKNSEESNSDITSDKKDNRIYFMEEKYGPGGNLMTRDIVSREIYAAGREVFLDVSFLDKNIIDKRLPEIRDLCKKYRNIDITKESIPVSPSVHFFMGGLAVHLNHETNIKNLFAVGECASMYHGANRLGGNSLLAAIHSGNVAAEEISNRPGNEQSPEFTEVVNEEQRILLSKLESASPFPAMYIRDMLAETMQKKMGIVRDEKVLNEGINDIDYDLSVVDQIKYDSSVLPYFNYSLTAMLTLARAALTMAKARKESRGAHFRSDYPEISEDYAYASLISFDNGKYNVWLDDRREFEN